MRVMDERDPEGVGEVPRCLEFLLKAQCVPRRGEVPSLIFWRDGRYWFVYEEAR